MMNSNNQNHLVDHNYCLPVAEEVVIEEGVIITKPKTYQLISGIHKESIIYVDNLGFHYYKRETRRDCEYVIYIMINFFSIK